MKKLLAVSLLTLGLGLSFSQAGHAATTEAKTKHPIVLVPGIFAFDSIAAIDYWYKIPAALQSQGATVFVPKINAFDSSAKRGEALIAQLDNIRASSAGKISKFNLIGHSQGGITVRYVMNTRPDLVASVTTMNTPHKGSPLADLVTGVAPASSLQGVAFTAFANAPVLTRIVFAPVQLVPELAVFDRATHARLGKHAVVFALDLVKRISHGAQEVFVGGNDRAVEAEFDDGLGFFEGVQNRAGIAAEGEKGHADL